MKKLQLLETKWDKIVHIGLVMRKEERNPLRQHLEKWKIETLRSFEVEKLAGNDVNNMSEKWRE